MHLQDEVTLLKTVDHPYKICHNIYSVYTSLYITMRQIFMVNWAALRGDLYDRKRLAFRIE